MDGTQDQGAQSLRGVAVLLVLMFHLKPTVFTLGFLGVDILFLISGYLTAKKLSKEPNIKEFYCNVFKRMVPLAYTIFLFVYIGCSFLLEDRNKEVFKEDLVWSLSFASNIQTFFDGEEYWNQVTTYRFFVHCWYVAVEIQFFTIAPFVLSGKVLQPIERKWVFLLLIAISYGMQIFSPPKTAFGLLPCRMWQYLLGCLCFEYSMTDDPKEDVKEKILEEGLSDDSNGIQKTQAEGPSKIDALPEIAMLFVCIVVFCNWTAIFHERRMRVLGTFSAALWLTFPPNPSKSFIINKFFTYIGDISYVLYLVQWPLIVAVKYVRNEPYLDIEDTVYLIASIFLISAVLHHTLEKFFTSTSLWTGLTVCFLCLVAIITTFPYFNQIS